MNHTHPMPGRRISGLSAVILVLTLTGCPLLDPPEPLKALLAEKEEKPAFKVDKEKNSVCRSTKDFDYGSMSTTIRDTCINTQASTRLSRFTMTGKATPLGNILYIFPVLL